MKKIIAILSAIAIAFCFCACGEFEFDEDALISDVMQNVNFDTDLQQVGETVINITYSVPKDTETVLYRGEATCSDQLAVFTCKDSSQVSELKEKLEETRLNLKETFASYAPDEVDKIEHAVVVSRDKYVAFCITADYENAEDIIEKHF